MTPEQARERAREWLHGQPQQTRAEWISEIAMLVYFVADEARQEEHKKDLGTLHDEIARDYLEAGRQEERKRCEEIVGDVLAGLIVSHPWMLGSLDEILRRLKEP